MTTSFNDEDDSLLSKWVGRGGPGVRREIDWSERLVGLVEVWFGGEGGRSRVRGTGNPQENESRNARATTLLPPCRLPSCPSRIEKIGVKKKKCITRIYHRYSVFN